MTDPRARIDSEVSDIIAAAEAIIRYANEIPESGLTETELARLGTAERLLLKALHGEVDVMAIRAHFRKWAKQEVLL